jgi:hypothetical protein
MQRLGLIVAFTGNDNNMIAGRTGALRTDIENVVPGPGRGYIDPDIAGRRAYAYGRPSNLKFPAWVAVSYQCRGNEADLPWKNAPRCPVFGN